MATKKSDIHVRVSDKRFDKLKMYAQEREYSITRVIEDLIDALEIKCN